MMDKSDQKKISRLGLCALLLLATATFAFAQQSAARPSTGAATTQAPASRDLHARVTETIVDSSIPDDPGVDRMVAVYSPKVRALNVVLGRLKRELKKGGTGAGSLGNFVADGMRAQGSLKNGKPIDLAVMNAGGLRRNTIAEGDLTARDIFELLPFENALVTVDLTGAQLLRLLAVVVTGREAQAGARITYIVKADKSSQLEKGTLVDPTGREKEIDPQATYSIVTIDYLVNVGGRYSVLREGKNMKPLGITLRDAIMDYVKSETAAHHDIKPNLDRRFILDRANSVLTGEPPPN